jgi:hypothetical protein
MWIGDLRMAFRFLFVPYLLVVTKRKRKTVDLRTKYYVNFTLIRTVTQD